MQHTNRPIANRAARTRTAAALSVVVGGALLGVPIPSPAGGLLASLGADVFIAGGAPVVREPVAGDLFVAGGSVEIDAAVAGDVTAGGGRIQLNDGIGGSLRAAAGQIVVHSGVGGDARVAGGQVEFAPRSAVAGDLAVAGGHVRLLGTVRGNVRAAGGHLSIDGVIGGDVVASAGDVELGPNARIAGALRHRGGSLRRDGAALVAGGIKSWPGWGRDATASSSPLARRTAAGPVIGWRWTVALVVLAALALAVAPRFHARIGHTLRQRPGLSLLLGMAWLVCAPVLLLLLLLTVIGIPLTLLGALLYVMLLPLAYVSTAIALGDAALRSVRVAAAASWAWRAVAAAVVVLLLAQATRLPWLGVPLASLAALAGLGALALQLRRAPSAG